MSEDGEVMSTAAVGGGPTAAVGGACLVSLRPGVAGRETMGKRAGGAWGPDHAGDTGFPLNPVAEPLKVLCRAVTMI